MVTRRVGIYIIICNIKADICTYNNIIEITKNVVKNEICIIIGELKNGKPSNSILHF